MPTSLPLQNQTPVPPQSEDDFVAAVRACKEGLLVDALLNDWVLVDYGHGRLHIKIKNSEKKHLLPALRTVVAQICGASWQVIVTEDSKAMPPTLAERYQQEALDQREALKTDPLLCQALDVFNNCLLTQVLPHD